MCHINFASARDRNDADIKERKREKFASIYAAGRSAARRCAGLKTRRTGRAGISINVSLGLSHRCIRVQNQHAMLALLHVSLLCLYVYIIVDTCAIR